MKNKTRPIHPLVAAILDDARSGAGLPVDALCAHHEALRSLSPEALRQRVGTELIVCAQKFCEGGADRTGLQLIFLAVQALGKERAAAALEAAGVSHREASQLLESAQHSGPKPPAPRGGGVSLRKK